MLEFSGYIILIQLNNITNAYYSYENQVHFSIVNITYLTSKCIRSSLARRPEPLSTDRLAIAGAHTHT